jgi:hypothetical protein
VLPAFSTRIVQGSLLALAIGLSACGGGGGGSSTPPVSNGGGPPPVGSTPTVAPSGAPTGNPTSGPTSGPTHAPTQAPTASPPPPTSQGITMLPDTTGRFGLLQINDAYGRNNAGMTSGQIQTEAPHTDSVWGAFQPAAWNAAHPGMIVSRYVLPNEDVRLISGHDLTWWQANHPDWILYACKSDGTPTHDVAASGTGFGDVALDIHNPSVVDYQIRQLVGPNMIQQGYNTIAADNITFVNYLFDPVTGAASKAYGCGVWQGNTFVRRYGPATGGEFDQDLDGNFTADLINWLRQARSILSTDPTLAPHHFKIIVNHPFVGSSPTATEQTMLQYVDGALDEAGFTHYGERVLGGNFITTLNWAQYTQSHGIAIFFADYFCVGSNSCPTDPSALTGSQIDWALAGYALANNGGANVYISPGGGAIYTYRSEYADRYGTPCGGYSALGNNVFTRRFSNGFAVVNAGSTSQSVQLPAHTYTDIGGRAVSNPLMVSGSDAYMLLTSGNGCS